MRLAVDGGCRRTSVLAGPHTVKGYIVVISCDSDQHAGMKQTIAFGSDHGVGNCLVSFPSFDSDCKSVLASNYVVAKTKIPKSFSMATDHLHLIVSGKLFSMVDTVTCLGQKIDEWRTSWWTENVGYRRRALFHMQSTLSLSHPSPRAIALCARS